MSNRKKARMMENSTQPCIIENPERKFLDILDKSMYCGLWPLSDGHICTDDGCVFNVHRVILASSSEYFRKLFLGLGRDNLRSGVNLPGITGDCLCNILIYLYTGQVQVTEANATDLLVGSDYLQLRDLHIIVKNSIKDCLTEYNCFRLLHAAYLIGDDSIFQKCFRFVQTEFERVCHQKDDLVELPLEILWKLLRCRCLNVDSERPVWQAIVDWTEKDISNRSHHVHQLILSLASEEIGEELATEILNHAIVSENVFITTSSSKTVKRKRCLNNSLDNLALLQSLMGELTYANTELYSLRIPPSQHIILFPSDFRPIILGPKIVYLYYSCGENIDLWMKTTPTYFYDFPSALIACHQRIYVFANRARQCKYFTLDTMEWKDIEDIRKMYCDSYSVVTAGKYIYISGRTSGRYALEVLDTENNTWSAVETPSSITEGKVVTVCGKIYVLNDDYATEMTFHAFDPDTQQWSVLPIPNVDRTYFVFLSHHQKIYVIGGNDLGDFASKPEVFDPNTNTWNELIDLPFEFSDLKGVIFQDKILVYGEDEADNRRNLIWNEEMERWEQVEANMSFLYTPYLEYCAIEDIEAKKLIRRQMRSPILTLDEVLSNSTKY